MLKQRFLVAVTILFVTFSHNAQDSAVKTEQSVNPVMIFKEAQNLISQNKRAEAKRLLDGLLQKFPNDFEIRGLYLEAIGTIESDEFFREKALEALEIYKKVPLAERTENFYERYRIVLRDLKKSGEMTALKNEIVQKFPRSRLATNLRVTEAQGEKDVVKAAELSEAIIKDFGNEPGINELYEILFSIISKDLTKFNAQKIASIAGKYEELQFKALIEESKPKTPRVTQYRYLQAVLVIADKLREKFPVESLRFAQKGLAFFEQMKTDENVEDFRILFRQAVFRSQMALEDWRNAQKVGAEILIWTKNSSPDERIDEAKFQRDYALVLKNLRQIPLAREHFFIASILDKEFQKDWKSFESKYPLAPFAKASFEKSIKTKFGKFLTSREAILKANLLKTGQNIPARDFRLQDLNGKQVSLEDYKGKILILNFWATWCEPCIGELEQMKTAYKNYSYNPKIAFAIVSTDKDKEKVPIEAKKRGYEFPVFYADEKIENDYKADSIPKLFIIDALGNIRFQKDGFNNNGYYLKELDWMVEASMK